MQPFHSILFTSFLIFTNLCHNRQNPRSPLSQISFNQLVSRGSTSFLIIICIVTYIGVCGVCDQICLCKPRHSCVQPVECKSNDTECQSEVQNLKRFAKLRLSSLFRSLKEKRQQLWSASDQNKLYGANNGDNDDGLLKQLQQIQWEFVCYIIRGWQQRRHQIHEICLKILNSGLASDGNNIELNWKSGRKIQNAIYSSDC